MTEPGSFLSVEQLREIVQLEAQKDLSVLDRRRLSALYSNELRSLKTGTPRYSEVRARINELAPSLDGYLAELRRVQDETKRFGTQHDDTKFSWKTLTIQQEYRAAYRLWNSNQTEQALMRIEKVLGNADLKAGADSGEWMRLLATRFRIALELSDTALTVASYQQMKEHSECDPQTAQAGFLTALQFFLKKDLAIAKTTFEQQCDPDESVTNKIRRKYWEARFSENDVPVAKHKYREIVQTKVPGFYFYLAHARLNQKIDFGPQALSTRVYLKEPLDVSNRVSELLTEAERRIAKNLRHDAAIYLTRALQLVKQSLAPDTHPALLYIAHLFQAAGAQLDSMRIYSDVTGQLIEDEAYQSEAAYPQIDYLTEMFPIPHLPNVEWLTSQWRVDPNLVYALMRQESAFNPGAVSVMDARGLMQLMPFLARAVAEQWGYHGYYNDRVLFRAAENLKIAIFHLHTLQEILHHPVLIAAAYNAGSNRVLNWWRRNPGIPIDVFIEMIPIHETRNYVKLVLRNYVHYQLVRDKGTTAPNTIPFLIPPFALTAPGGA